MLAKIRSLLSSFLTAVLAKPLTKLVTAMGLPAVDAEIAEHFVVVFGVTFVVQVVGAYTGLHSEGSVTAVIYAALTGAFSTAGHQLLGLIPSKATKKS